MFKLFGRILSGDELINTKGIGLGLVICQLIVERFGNVLDFTSEFKNGSNFFFSFNLDDKPQQN